MKKADVNRLEKAVEHYRKIEDLLGEAYESIYEGRTERVGDATTVSMVRELLDGAINERLWVERRAQTFRELQEGKICG